MIKRTKLWIAAAILLILIGLGICCGAMAKLDWDFKKLSTDNFVTNNYEITEAFDSIYINTDTADIAFVQSEGTECRVVCHEQAKVKHSVSVNEGVLSVTVNDTRKWYEYINFGFTSPEITVYLPDTEYKSILVNESTGDVEIAKEIKVEDIDVSVDTGDVKCYSSAKELIKIATDTGDISLENVTAKSITLSVSTGKITASEVLCTGDIKITVSTGKTRLSNIECKKLISVGNTGDITISHLLATEKISIERSTGDIKFEDTDAPDIYFKASTGDVTGTLLSEKVFIANTSTGKKRVPNTTTGGRCEVTTSTGNIIITIK